MQFPNFDKFASLGESLAGRLSFFDNTFRIVDNADETKKLAFELSGLTTATTRTMTLPDRDFTLGGGDGTRRAVVDTGGAYATPIALTTAQSGRFILVDDAAGLDFTLPAIAAADVGTYFEFLVTVTITSNNFRVTAQSGDLLVGRLPMFDFDTANTVTSFAPNGSSHLVMTCNGSTTGGKSGTHVTFTATRATEWTVTGKLYGDGVLATPFS
jgi:hypothetical protein